MARRRLIALLCICAVFTGGTGSAQQQTVNTAGVIVDTGAGDPVMIAVAFEEAELPAIDLLERSGLASLTVPFGGLGEGVCKIETTGCDVTACRRALCQSGADAPFWQFLEREQGGEWVVSPLGASSVSVGNGDATAWIWSADTPPLPETSFADLIGATGQPTLDNPAQFPLPPDPVADGNRQAWITGLGFLAATSVIGTVILRRGRHGAR